MAAATLSMNRAAVSDGKQVLSSSGSGALLASSKRQARKSLNSGSSSNEFEALLQKPDVSPSARRSTASGISLGSRKRATTASESNLVVTHNPLLAARERAGSHRSRSVSAAAPAPAETEPAVAAEAAAAAPAIAAPVEAERRVTVKHSFAGSSEKELGVEAGTSVSVIRTLASGWTVARTDDGRVGAVPTSYLNV